MSAVAFGDIVDIRKGKKPKIVFDQPVDGSRPCILIDEVRGANPLSFTPDQKGVDVEPDDLCIVWDGANAGTVGFGVSGFLGSTVARLRFKNPNNWDAGFVGRLLQGKFATLNDSAKGKGATIPHVDKRHLEELLIPQYSFNEQKRIAAILDQADALRRLRQRAVDRLNTLGQAIFHEMFGRKRSPKLVELKALGQVKTGSTPSTKVAEYFDGDIPFMTPGDLETDRPVARYLSAAGAEKSRSVVAGSTLVCCIGATIGKTDIAHKNCTFNQQINAIEWSNDISSAYGYYAVRGLRPEIERMGRGASTTLPILKKSLFQELRIPIADRNDQVQFEERIKAVEKQKGMYSSSAACAENLFSSLQSRAFRGEL
mgnify:CR=1 FL=1